MKVATDRLQQGAPHEPDCIETRGPAADSATVQELPLRTRLPMLPMRVRRVLSLRKRACEPTLGSMDPRLVVGLLAEERTTFVRLARHRLRTDADAEDVVQRAMIRAAERAGSLDDPERVRAWFGRTLRRGIADFYRSRRPERASDSAGGEVASDAPEIARTPCQCTLRLPDDLPAGYAEVLKRGDADGRCGRLRGTPERRSQP